MLVLDYHNIFEHQYDDINKSRRKISFYFGNWFANRMRSFTKRMLARLHNVLLSQLLKSKGLLADLTEKAAVLKGGDMSEIITWSNKLLKVNILLKDELDKLILEDAGNTYPELAASNAIVEETIENLYSILRILKYCNNHSAIETTGLAFNSSKHSVHSLQTVMHGRRAT